VDVGQDKASGEPLKQEGQKLIKYFLASLAIPEKDLWVNLSPYEKDRTIPEELSKTDMGRDLLAQDYILKQITASLIYPEKQLGKTFWDKIYTKAQQLYGTTEIPVNTFNKVWIMADKAEVFEHNGSAGSPQANTAFVTDSHLKVMLEEDYLALEKNQTPTRGHVAGTASASNVSPSTLPSETALNVKAPQGQPSNALASQIVRDIILPELEKEVNTGKNFANLRQIFNSLILASWYKKNLKEALLNQVYSDKSKIKGIELKGQSSKVKEQIYQQYLQAYKKGVFNYIKEDIDPSTGSGQAPKTIPRKYFSGGMRIGASQAMTVTTNPLRLAAVKATAWVLLAAGMFWNPLDVDRAKTFSTKTPTSVIAFAVAGSADAAKTDQAMVTATETVVTFDNGKKFPASEVLPVIRNMIARTNDAHRTELGRIVLLDWTRNPLIAPISSLATLGGLAELNAERIKFLLIARSLLQERNFPVQVSTESISATSLESEVVIDEASAEPLRNWLQQKEASIVGSPDRAMTTPAAPNRVISFDSFDALKAAIEDGQVGPTDTVRYIMRDDGDANTVIATGGTVAELLRKMDAYPSSIPSLDVKRSTSISVEKDRAMVLSRRTLLQAGALAVTGAILKPMSVFAQATALSVDDQRRVQEAVVSLRKNADPFVSGIIADHIVDLGRNMMGKWSGFNYARPLVDLLEPYALPVSPESSRLLPVTPEDLLRNRGLIRITPDSIDGGFNTYGFPTIADFVVFFSKIVQVEYGPELASKLFFRLNDRLDQEGNKPVLSLKEIQAGRLRQIARLYDSEEFRRVFSDQGRTEIKQMLGGLPDLADAMAQGRKVYRLPAEYFEPGLAGAIGASDIQIDFDGKISSFDAGLFITRVFINPLSTSSGIFLRPDNPNVKRRIDLKKKTFLSLQEQASVPMPPPLIKNEDKAAVARGGIDLTQNGMNWSIRKDGTGVEMNVDPAMIERIRREGIQSLSPFILRVTPMSTAGIWAMIGLEPPKRQEERLAGV